MYETVIVQVRLRSLPLVSIWIALSYLPVGDPLGLIPDNPMCGILLERFGTPYSKNYAPDYSYLCPYPGCYSYGLILFIITSRCLL